MIAKTCAPSKALLARVRAEFVIRGTSFNAWCKANGIVRRTAEQALVGDNKSENARTLVRGILSTLELPASQND